MRKSLAKSAKTFYIPHKSPQGDKYGKKICTTDSISLSIKSRINGQAEYASRQGRDIAFLQKQNRFLTEALRNAQSTVKPLEEETPPPHY